jgi:hypothetical protein
VNHESTSGQAQHREEVFLRFDIEAVDKQQDQGQLETNQHEGAEPVRDGEGSSLHERTGIDSQGKLLASHQCTAFGD